jgi:hypothetical protein
MEETSLAHAGALKLRGRQFTIGVAMLVVVALVAGTAGTSYAHKRKGPVVQDTVVVTNYGSAFAGSLDTFAAGSAVNAKPFKVVKGTNTLLGVGTGPGGDAQSSTTGQIAVTVPLVLLPLPFPNGFVELYSAGANGNSQPDSIIASPTALGVPDVTGLSLPDGVAYANPFQFVGPNLVIEPDEIAVANFTPAVFGPDLGIPGLGLCAPNAPGFSLGTITEYSTAGLPPFSPPFNGLAVIPPLNNSPVTILDAEGNPVPHNATIGGCDTFLLGPVGVAFDASGFLYVVNNAGGYVTIYTPGAFGNALPIGIIGTGIFKSPAFITVESGTPQLPFGLPNDTIYVSDDGDNSVKIFSPFDPLTCFTGALPFGCFGTELGVIQDSKLKRPQGVALSPEGNLYVVNNNGNSLNEYDDVGTDGGNSPTLVLSGHIGGTGSALNLPVGIALKQFILPTATPTATATATATATPTPGPE